MLVNYKKQIIFTYNYFHDLNTNACGITHSFYYEQPWNRLVVSLVNTKYIALCIKWHIVVLWQNSGGRKSLLCNQTRQKGRKKAGNTEGFYMTEGHFQKVLKVRRQRTQETKEWPTSIRIPNDKMVNCYENLLQCLQRNFSIISV